MNPAAAQVVLPSVDGGFRCLLADPPWSFSDKGSRIAPDERRGEGVRHYRTMTLRGIAEIPVEDIAAADALLFLWTTSAHLLDGSAAHVATCWGFEPRTTMAWVKRGVTGKIQIGCGHYVRGSHEHLVVCRRGKARVLRRDVPSVFFAPRSRHSAKPDESYRIVESLAEGPRLELFARAPRYGWAVWGNEADGRRAA